MVQSMSGGVGFHVGGCHDFRKLFLAALDKNPMLGEPGKGAEGGSWCGFRIGCVLGSTRGFEVNSWRALEGKLP